MAAVMDAEGVPHRLVEAGRERALATVFGEVTVRRLAYRAAGRANLHPANAALNLPAEKHRLLDLPASPGTPTCPRHPLRP